MTQKPSAKLDQEIIQLTQQIRQQPHDVHLLMQLASKLMQVADFTQAQGILAQAAKLAPKRADIRYNQAVVAHELHQDKQAIHYLENLQKSDLRTEVNYLLALIYYQHQQFQLATVYALTAAEQKTQGFNENLLLAQVLTRQQLWRQAFPYAKKAYALKEKSADAAFVLGGCLVNLKQLQPGQKLLRQAAQADPNQYQKVVRLILTQDKS